MFPKDAAWKMGTSTARLLAGKGGSER